VNIELSWLGVGHIIAFPSDQVMCLTRAGKRVGGAAEEAQTAARPNARARHRERARERERERERERGRLRRESHLQI
jgi:hypothetical protein